VLLGQLAADFKTVKARESYTSFKRLFFFLTFQYLKFVLILCTVLFDNHIPPSSYRPPPPPPIGLAAPSPVPPRSARATAAAPPRPAARSLLPLHALLLSPPTAAPTVARLAPARAAALPSPETKKKGWIYFKNVDLDFGKY